MASRIIAPRVAMRMDPRLICVIPWPPKRPWTMKPPTNAPAIPIKIVIMIPPGSGPGMTHLASAPAMSPITINATMPMRFHLPQYILLAPTGRHPQAQYNRCLTSGCFRRFTPRPPCINNPRYGQVRACSREQPLQSGPHEGQGEEQGRGVEQRMNLAGLAP